MGRIRTGQRYSLLFYSPYKINIEIINIKGGFENE
jgi:hypothetical protein